MENITEEMLKIIENSSAYEILDAIVKQDASFYAVNNLEDLLTNYNFLSKGQYKHFNFLLDYEGSLKGKDTKKYNQIDSDRLSYNFVSKMFKLINTKRNLKGEIIGDYEMLSRNNPGKIDCLSPKIFFINGKISIDKKNQHLGEIIPNYPVCNYSLISIYNDNKEKINAIYWNRDSISMMNGDFIPSTILRENKIALNNISPEKNYLIHAQALPCEFYSEGNLIKNAKRLVKIYSIDENENEGGENKKVSTPKIFDKTLI